MSLHDSIANLETVSGTELRRVGEFLVFQGITMAGNLFYDFLCVRLLPIADNAKYGLAFGFLGSIGIPAPLLSCQVRS
jgi:hypothetical protein